MCAHSNSSVFRSHWAIDRRAPDPHPHLLTPPPAPTFPHDDGVCEHLVINYFSPSRCFLCPPPHPTPPPNHACVRYGAYCPMWYATMRHHNTMCAASDEQNGVLPRRAVRRKHHVENLDRDGRPKVKIVVVWWRDVLSVQQALEKCCRRSWIGGRRSVCGDGAP